MRQEQSRLQAIFQQQLARYPQMQLEDLYKLVYQATLGPAHLIRDSVQVYQSILEELQSIPAVDEPLCDTISPDGRYLRINLKSFKYRGGDPRHLAQLVYASTGSQSDARKVLIRRWQSVGLLIDQKKLPFERSSYDSLTQTLQQAGFPPRHHSEIYRRLYQPAYRVVARQIWEQTPACPITP